MQQEINCARCARQQRDYWLLVHLFRKQEQSSNDRKGQKRVVAVVAAAAGVVRTSQKEKGGRAWAASSSMHRTCWMVWIISRKAPWQTKVIFTADEHEYNSTDSAVVYNFFILLTIYITRDNLAVRSALRLAPQTRRYQAGCMGVGYSPVLSVRRPTPFTRRRHSPSRHGILQCYHEFKHKASLQLLGCVP